MGRVECHFGDFRDLLMYGSPQSGEDSLMEGLGHRRMGMDGMGDIIEHRTHLQSEGEFPGQLADVTSHTLYS